MSQLLKRVLATSKKLRISLDKPAHLWYNFNMDNIPQLQNAVEDLFKKLVLEGLTLTAIRQEMFPSLEGIDDIPLIQKMIKIREKE